MLVPSRLPTENVRLKPPARIPFLLLIFFLILISFVDRGGRRSPGGIKIKKKSKIKSEG